MPLERAPNDVARVAKNRAETLTDARPLVISLNEALAGRAKPKAVQAG
jgi:hypothetical protein